MEPKTIIKRSYKAPCPPLVAEGLRFDFFLSILKLLQLEIYFYDPNFAITILLSLVAPDSYWNVHRSYRLSSYLTSMEAKETQRIAKTLGLFANNLAFFAVRPLFHLVPNPDSYRDSV